MFLSFVRPFAYKELVYNKKNPTESRIKLQLENNSIIDLPLKINGTSIFGEPPPTAIWNPETHEIIDAEWLRFRPFAVTPGFERFTFYDMCKLSYDTQNKNVNYFVYEAYLDYIIKDSQSTVSNFSEHSTTSV
jgi:hypothetical protein